MKLYFYGLIMLIKKFIFRKNTGEVIRSFVEKMGVVYIKFAQMLAMQNIGNFFTEEDQIKLSTICDHCKPIPFKKIKKQIEKEYGCSMEQKFKKVFEEPIGSASISQVHKAILKNGEVVAIKVKRKDITKRIEKDINQIRKITHRFGRFVNFNNYLGSDAALNLFLDWIHQETDFENEKNNILRYYKFACSVNGKVENTKKVVVPKVYKKFCTKNIIVMEYIHSKTINQMSLTNQNKEKIRKSLNDYVLLSFHALFNDIPVIFHGDPHGGNIYIDKEGNIGFLDMGLIFAFNVEEEKWVRKLFFNAYSCNVENLMHLLLDDSNNKNVDMNALEEEVLECCLQFKKIPVTEFFVNMIFIFTKYNIDPHPVLYKMAKTFVSLYGMNTFINNTASTEQLLYEQIVAFFVNRTMNDVKELTSAGINFLPSFIKNTMEKGLTKSIAEQIVTLSNMNKKLNESVHNFDEVLAFFK